MAVWSGVNVAGTSLQDVSPKAGSEEDPENWEQIHKDVVNRCLKDLLLVFINTLCSLPCFFVTILRAHGKVHHLHIQ